LENIFEVGLFSAELLKKGHFCRFCQLASDAAFYRRDIGSRVEAAHVHAMTQASSSRDAAVNVNGDGQGEYLHCKLIT
jgi:hypothetical protein